MTPALLRGREPALLLLLLGAACVGPAAAQVMVDPDALNAPPPAHPAAPSRPAVRPVPGRPSPARPGAPAGPSNPPVAAAQPAVRLGLPPAPPVTPPAPPVVPPPVVVPLARPAPPPPIPVNDDAPGAATPLPAGGVRITFGPDRQDMNPGTVEALRAFAATQKGQDGAALNVMAFAAGRPDDPSMARRLSLARALAARAVLINEGLPSTRIYVRALGNSPADAPPDRVDVVPAAAPTPPPTLTAAPPVAPVAPAPAQAPAPVRTAPASTPARR